MAPACKDGARSIIPAGDRRAALAMTVLSHVEDAEILECDSLPPPVKGEGWGGGLQHPHFLPASTAPYTFPYSRAASSQE